MDLHHYKNFTIKFLQAKDILCSNLYNICRKRGRGKDINPVRYPMFFPFLFVIASNYYTFYRIIDTLLKYLDDIKRILHWAQEEGICYFLYYMVYFILYILYSRISTSIRSMESNRGYNPKERKTLKKESQGR